MLRRGIEMAERRYLLDTNMLSHLVRQPEGPVATRIARAGEEKVLTSIIVACELRFTAAKRASARLTRQVETVLAALDALPFEADADRHDAAIGTALERKGTPIGANDILIAAHARALDAVCVTNNTAGFKLVPALKVENWLTWARVDAMPHPNFSRPTLDANMRPPVSSRIDATNGEVVPVFTLLSEAYLTV